MDKWTAGEAPKVCEKCDFVGDDGYMIAIHPDVLAAAFHLCKEIKLEWQMLLTGTVQDNKVYCTGYYIPKQEVSHSTVKNLEAIDRKFVEDKDIVATLHSHSTMAVFFSSVDDEYTNMSWIKHHVVINNTHEFVAKSRHDLPCGGVKFVNSKIETMIPAGSQAQGMENITKYEYKSNYPANSGFNTGGHSSYLERGYSEWMPEEGHWENGVWQPATKGRSKLLNGYKKHNGIWKEDEIAY